MLEDTFQPYSNRGCKCRRKRKARPRERNTTEGQTPVGSPRSTDQHEIVRNETSNAPDASGSAQLSRAPVAEFDEAGPSNEEKTIPSSTLRSSPSTS